MPFEWNACLEPEVGFNSFGGILEELLKGPKLLVELNIDWLALCVNGILQDKSL